MTRFKYPQSERYTPEYTAWTNMKARCFNKNTAGYERYGGRGITVYELWINDYMAFLESVGRRPDPTYTLDRIDNDKGYMPDNLRWATRRQQVVNQGLKVNNQSGIKGVRKNNSAKGDAWIASIGWFGSHTIGYYPTKEAATRGRTEYVKGINQLLDTVKNNLPKPKTGLNKEYISGSNVALEYVTRILNEALLQDAKNHNKEES